MALWRRRQVVVVAALLLSLLLVAEAWEKKEGIWRDTEALSEKDKEEEGIWRDSEALKEMEEVIWRDSGTWEEKEEEEERVWRDSVTLEEKNEGEEGLWRDYGTLEEEQEGEEGGWRDSGALEEEEKEKWRENGAFLLEIQDWVGSTSEQGLESLPRLLLDKDEEERMLWDDIFSLYLPSVDANVTGSDECSEVVGEIMRVYKEPILMMAMLKKMHLWPLQLPDSWGKLPDGILYGNIHPWGMQEECTFLDVKENVTRPSYNTTFKGRYCLVNYRMYGENDTTTTNDVRDSLLHPSIRSSLFMSYEKTPSIFSYGTCIPANCTLQHLQRSLNHVLHPVGKDATYLNCHHLEDTVTFEAKDIAYITVLSIFGALLLSSSVLDVGINYLNKQQLRKGGLRFLLVFSAYSNMKKIFNINLKESKEVISCLHGIRVLSMVWVVWGHSYMIQMSVANNALHFVEMSKRVVDQTIMNGSFSVDTFFFMSGLLVAYGSLREHHRAGQVNWILFYVHRFLRLTPPILLTVGAMATIARFLMDGPASGMVERTYVTYCTEHWWVDPLFVSNFVFPNCLPQCWYTAVDSQLYLVVPLVLYPLHRWPKTGLAWLALVTVVSCAIPAIVIGVYDQPGDLFLAKPEVKPKDWINVYSTPWCRASTYLVGVWAGWILFTFKGKTLKLRTWQWALGWVLSTGVALAVIYGPYHYNNFYNRDLLPQEVSIIYGGLSRASYAVSLLWIVFACQFGHGGPINSILSHPCWQPISRLTYSLYLTTIPLQVVYMGIIHTPLYVSHLNKFIETCGYLIIGGLVAVPISLMVEAPVLGLEKLIFKRPGRAIQEGKDAAKKN